MLCVGILLVLVACTGDPPAAVPSSTSTPTARETTTAPPVADTTTPEPTQSVGGDDVDVPLSTVPATPTPTTTTTRTSTAATHTKTPDAVYPPYAQVYSYAGYTPRQTDTEPWNLMLLNTSYCLPEDYIVDTVATENGIKIDRRVYPAYKSMSDAATKEDISLAPLSGWRSLAKQKTNLENDIAARQQRGLSRLEATKQALTVRQIPGCSEHNAGLSFDILSLETSFDQTKAYQWLDAHAQDYGFILRYPKNKVALTGVSYEPWHWRYVGINDAKKIKASGQCLEEYLGAMNN